MKNALCLTTALASIIWGLACQPAFADEETLKKEIKLLEKRIAQLEKQQKQQAQRPLTLEKAATASRLAPSAGEARKGSVEQRLAIVERKQEVAQEEAQAKAANTPKIDYTPGRGFSIYSPDKQYGVRVSPYIQADNRTFFDSGAAGTINTFIIRSARPLIEAKMTDYFDGRFMMDFGKGTTTLLDAYGDFHPMAESRLINLRAGEFKVPVGIERWQPESDVWFVERGQTTNLVPYRDIGAMAWGQLANNVVEYHMGVTNGAADLQANTGDTDNNKDYFARLFVRPFAATNIDPVKGLALGVGGTYGVHQGSVATPSLAAGYVTFGQRTYFTFKAGDFADGPQWRFNPQAMYFYGPFGLIGEMVDNTQEIRNGTHVERLTNDAWLGTASYVLTGEDAAFDGVTPAHNFNPKSGDWGAFEVLGRVSELKVDHKAFAGSLFADPAVSAREAFETTLGGTWYFNRAVKVNLDLSRTTFKGGFTGGIDHPDEKAIVSRLQVKF
jgi:phosphate-selective porin OprO/OprP